MQLVQMLSVYGEALWGLPVQLRRAGCAACPAATPPAEHPKASQLPSIRRPQSATSEATKLESPHMTAWTAPHPGTQTVCSFVNHSNY